MSFRILLILSKVESKVSKRKIWSRTNLILGSRKLVIIQLLPHLALITKDSSSGLMPLKLLYTSLISSKRETKQSTQLSGPIVGNIKVPVKK